MSARAAQPAVDRGHALALLEGMLRIRRFEETCAELYQAGKIRGFLHLYIGEEAVAVGATQALAPDDAVVSTYREHGHALARGDTAAAMRLAGRAVTLNPLERSYLEQKARTSRTTAPAGAGLARAAAAQRGDPEAAPQTGRAGRSPSW